MKEQQLEPSAVRRKTVIAFVIFFLLCGGGFAAWRAVYGEKPTASGARPRLRKVLSANERLWSGAVDSVRRTKEYPKSAAVRRPRVNGDAGMSDGFDPAAWRLKIARAPGDTFSVSLAEIQALPKTEIVFDFKCIEGWDQVTHWGGVRVSDLIARYGLKAASGKAYTGLVTPDGGYYVGIDRASLLHPQTILCYEMNGKPLPTDQGAPLRLIIPVKYGIKHLKRIGTMYFSDSRPPDYWAERGYDYFAGL